MHTIGFSTGALALADFRAAIGMLRRAQVPAVELSALRSHELASLLQAIRDEDLAQGFDYVSLHAPSSFEGIDEAQAAKSILEGIPEHWPVVLHPDASSDLNLWKPFGDRLLIENMDRRKPCARTLKEMRDLFERLPDASFCFDIGHARQVDRTMLEAAWILTEFGSKVRQVHVSEVNTASRHERLSDAVIFSFREVAHLIPKDAVLILETPTPEDEISREIRRATEIFVPDTVAAVG